MLAIHLRRYVWCRCAGATLGSFSLLVSSLAFSQIAASDSANEKSDALDEIVITAQRRLESQNKVPISLTAVTPAQLDNFDLRTTDALQLITPDLTFNKGYGYAQNYIRGIGSQYTNPGLESAVATYVDGAYLERSLGSAFDLLDAGTVQILKGPQGTLYGRNATGGAILITTADPTDIEEARVAAEGGSLSHALGEVIVNLPIADTLALRLAAREVHDGGFINNLNNDEKFGARTSGEVRAKLRWKPTDDFKAVLGFDHSEVSDRAGATQERLSAPLCLTCSIPGAGVGPVAGFYNSDNDTNSPFITRSTSVHLKIDYVKDIYHVTSLSSFRNDATEALIDYDLSPIFLYNYSEGQHGKTYSQDIQLVTDSAGWLNGLVAVTYFRDKADIYADLSGGAFAPLVAAVDESPASTNDVLTQSESVVLEGYISPLSHLKVTAGARYTHDSRTLGVDANIAGLLATGQPPTNPTLFNQKASFDSTTPRFVIAYDLEPVNLYASFNRGFKSGGFNTPTFSQQANIKPEKIDSYEIGAKFVSANRRVHANIAGFHYKYSDVQVSVVNLQQGGASIQNAGSAVGIGSEGDIAFKAFQWLELIAGAAYLDAHYTNYPNASVVNPTATGLVGGTAENLAGSPLTRAPKWTEYVGATVNTEIGNNWATHASVLAHRSSQYDFNPSAGGPLGYDKQPAYTLANLTAGIGPSDGRYDFGIYVNNLTNAKYYVQRSTAAPFGAFDQVARPLTFGARIEYKFK